MVYLNPKMYTEGTEMVIKLNQKQLTLCKEWAADDRLWTTQETVTVNLQTFARAILRDAENTEPNLRKESETAQRFDAIEKRVFGV